MITVHKCLVCSGEAPFFFENYSQIADKSCPKCGTSDPKLTPRDRKQEFAQKALVAVRMPGDNRFDSEMDRAMDRANQRHIEDNWDDYESGKKKLVVPKNRPKEFDPRQLHEKRLY